ncbi:DEAD/DEAH box helicase family protein [Streptomyces griseoincarnatus]
MGDELATADTEAETASETESAALPGPLPLPEGAEPVDGVTGYHALIKGSSVTVFGPDGTEIASGSRRGGVAVGRVGGARLVSDGYGDRKLSNFAMLAARHHQAANDPSVRDKVWVRWEEDGVAAVYGTDKYDDDDLRAVKAGNLYWSGQRQARVTGRRWNQETRDRNLAAVLQAFARQDRNIVVLGPGQTPENLATSPTAAATVPAQRTPPAAPAPPPGPEPESEPEPEPLDLTGLSYEELVEAEDAAAMERSRDNSTAAEARYQALRQERGRRLLDRVTTSAPVTTMSDEDLAAESEWWRANSYKTPFHSSDEEYRTLDRHFRAVRTEQYARIARTILAGPAAADLDDEALESTHEQVGRTWTRLPREHELHDQIADYRKAVQEERIARRARSYGERTPVGEMALEDLIAESDELGSSLNATNEQSSYSYSEAVKEARAARLKAVEAECFQRGLEQNPDAARARLGANLGGRRTVLIDGSDRGYGYVERQGKKFRALTSYDQRSNIGDFDSAPAAMAALVRRYDRDPETLPRRTWGLEREVDLPVSAHDPLVSWLRRRPSELSPEYDRVLTLLTPYQLPTRTKVANPLTNQVMQAYPFHFEEGLLGELARIAERTTEDLREQSLDENLPKREREAAKRRIPTMGAALIGINAVIDQVRAAGGDVERRGVDQSRLAAQMAALAGTVDEQEGGEADGDDEPVRDAAAQALGGVPAAGTGGDAGPGPVLPAAGGADVRGDRRGGGGPGGEPGAGDGLPGPGRTAGADQGDGAGAGAARDAAAAGGRGQPGGAAESGSGGAGGDPQGAGEPVARFRPDPADLPRGPLARAEANLEAINVLRTLESACRGATTEEKRILARWSGWGSVPTVFLDEPDPDEPIYRPGGEWEGRFEADHARWESYDRVRGELRELLDPFEWRAASRAVLSAHYTPQGVAEAMWQGLAAYGFDGGEVLEAGCGSGAFFGVAPEAARLTGVEVDPTTAAIAARIYPHANVLPESFTDTDAPVGTFDLVIGNVPFAQAPFGERRYGATGHSLHNGFIIKQLALLRPGGYMAVITSRWTLDGEDTSARRAMSRWGDLAAAYRLPAGTFGETADTDVVADVLVFRRRAEDEEPGDQRWIDAPERELGGNTLAVNAYWTEHPENVLGRLTSETGPYGPRVTVQGDPGEAPRLLRERMEASAAAAVAAGQGYVPHEDGPDRAPLLLQTAREKHATDFTGRPYTDDDGQIWQHVNGEDPVRVITADGVTGTEQLRMLLSLRDTASELQELDRTGSDPDRAREVRSQLARLHAAYTMAHGPLSRPRQTRMALPTDEARDAARAAGVELDDDERLPTGWGWFRQDPHAAVVLGLEHWDRANDRPVPSEVLTRRPGARRGDLEPTDDPKTALTAVMGATGGVDLPLIASLLGTTPEEARRRLGTEVFDNPVTKKLEHAGAYLSGPVRVKLEQARKAAATDPTYAVNVAALEAVQPPPKRLGQFTAQLGAHWIPVHLVQGFLREYLGDPTLQVSHNERYGWTLAAGKVPDAVNALKGTERRSAVHIAKALLGRASMVVNTLDGDGVDEDATRAMRYKADAMRSAFEDYCTATTSRVAQLTDAYNWQMNGHVVRSYDGLAPSLAGLTTERTPHPWQLSAAARMQFERGVVLAHEMGLGKTTTMVMGSQALKASGQIAKPFAVVQPHLARQWLDEAKLLYPNADIHLITSDDLADGNRRRILEWLRSNTPDLVIFTEGAFGSIRMSPEQQELYLFREIESLKEQLKRERGVPHNNFALMQLERRLTTVEARIRRNAAPMRTPGEVYWEDLGFDYALVDEAHRFTAVGFRSKEAGGETASVRAVDMHQKLRWHHQVAEVHGGRPTVTLGTGTPMENSIFEQYSVLELATPWLLDQFGVHGPDLWAETFGQKVQRIEMAPDGSGLTIVERFSRFVSKSTMKTMWGLAADTKTGDDVGIVRPKLAGGAPELVLVEPTADQRARLQTLVARGQAIHAGDVTRDEDNMLAVSGEGRAVALDPRLVDAGAPAANKLVTAADIIAAGYHAHKDRTYAVSSRDDTPHPVPGGLFFVFCNSGTPGGNNKGGFDLYAELRDLLAGHRRGHRLDAQRRARHDPPLPQLRGRGPGSRRTPVGPAAGRGEPECWTAHQHGPR